MAEQGARDGRMAPGAMRPGAVRAKPSGKTSSREQGPPTPSTSKAAVPGAWTTQDGGFIDSKEIGTDASAPGQHG